MRNTSSASPFSAPAKTRVGVAPGVGWIRQGTENGALVDDKNRGAFNRAGTYLDISIDYTFESEDVPVVAVFGHSLNAGANQNPDVPHKGEVEVWRQLWARDHGGGLRQSTAGRRCVDCQLPGGLAEVGSGGRRRRRLCRDMGLFE